MRLTSSLFRYEAFVKRLAEHTSSGVEVTTQIDIDKSEVGGDNAKWMDTKRYTWLAPCLTYIISCEPTKREKNGIVSNYLITTKSANHYTCIPSG